MTSTAAAPARVQPTAAFFCDPRAAVLFLRDTVASLITRYGITHVYVDLTTLAGMTVATACLQQQVPYEHLDFGQEIPEPSTGNTGRFKLNRPRSLADLPQLMHHSAGTHRITLEKLAEIDAGLVVVPAMLDERLIDFSPNTIVGQVLTQLEERKRELLVIGPPERGLRPVHDADAPSSGAEHYERQTMLVRPEQ